MYVHMFEVTAPDGGRIHVQAFTVVCGERNVKVRHRMVELPDPDEPDTPWLAADAEDWDDFSLEEDDEPRT